MTSESGPDIWIRLALKRAWEEIWPRGTSIPASEAFRRKVVWDHLRCLQSFLAVRQRMVLKGAVLKNSTSQNRSKN
jgi:hypothetical protein